MTIKLSTWEIIYWDKTRWFTKIFANVIVRLFKRFTFGILTFNYFEMFYESASKTAFVYLWDFCLIRIYFTFYFKVIGLLENTWENISVFFSVCWLLTKFIYLYIHARFTIFIITIYLLSIIRNLYLFHFLKQISRAKWSWDLRLNVIYKHMFNSNLIHKPIIVSSKALIFLLVIECRMLFSG